MSEDQYEDLFDDNANTQDEQPKGPQKLREALARKDARIAELEAQAVAREAQDRDVATKSFVKDKGLPEKALSLIGDRDPQEWFAEFGDLFTPATAETEGAAEAGQTAPATQALSTEEQAAIAAVSGVQAGTFAPGSSTEMDSKLDSLESTAKTPDEFYAGLRAMGAGV